MVLIQVLNSLLQFRTPLTLLNGHDEQFYVGIQRELVHGIYAAHVIQDKEQDGGSLGRRSVALQAENKINATEYLSNKIEITSKDN